ncbi:MAG TPA: hypothetical protein VJH34_02090 [archaeon]|nr:hypothetical protein [archaeon]
MKSYVLLILAVAFFASASYVIISDSKPTTITSSFVEQSDAKSSDSKQTDIIAQLTCPASCDDGNRCTTDYCSDKTGYNCVHENIEGCCNVGKVYCDGKCTITRCIVDKDCYDGLDNTSDECINPNSCLSDCKHILVGNQCGNGICENNEKTTCPADCSITSPVATSQDSGTNKLKVNIYMDNGTFSTDENITITIHVDDGSNPIYNADVNASIKYPSGYVKYPSKTNKKVQNYTDQNGDFIWVFSTDKAGTFNISAIANSDGYNQVSSYRTFDIQ